MLIVYTTQEHFLIYFLLSLLSFFLQQAATFIETHLQLYFHRDPSRSQLLTQPRQSNGKVYFQGLSKVWLSSCIWLNKDVSLPIVFQSFTIVKMGNQIIMASISSMIFLKTFNFIHKFEASVCLKDLLRSSRQETKM